MTPEQKEAFLSIYVANREKRKAEYGKRFLDDRPLPREPSWVTIPKTFYLNKKNGYQKSLTRANGEPLSELGRKLHKQFERRKKS